MSEDDDSGAESEGDDSGEDTSDGADEGDAASDDDGMSDDAESGDDQSSSDETDAEGEEEPSTSDESIDEPVESPDPADSASVDDHDVGEVETTDDRDEPVESPDPADSASVDDHDVGELETTEDRSDVEASPTPPPDDKGDIAPLPEAIDKDAAVVTASQSPDADRASLPQGDRATDKPEGQAEARGGAKASGGGGSGGGGGGRAVTPKARSAAVTNAGASSAVKAAREFLAKLQPAKPTATAQPAVANKATASATPAKPAPAKATLAAKAPLVKPTQAQPLSGQALKGPAASSPKSSTQPLASGNSPASEALRVRSSQAPRGAGDTEAKKLATQQQGGRKVARRMTGNGNSTPPIFASQYYGFWDEKNNWQQAGPLGWEEAGHQITAAMSLGRHCFLWDGGLRKWRPIALEPSHAADVVHGTLAAAGWSPDSRAAILQGPETWRRQDQAERGHSEDIVKIPRSG